MTVYRFDKHIPVRRRRFLQFSALSLGVVIVFFVAFYFLFLRSDGQTPVEGQSVTVEHNPFSEFSTNYFRFSASSAWRNAEDLGNDTDTFVFRKYNDTTPTGLLTIRVNTPNQTLNVGVVPVVVKDGRITEIGMPSEHCSKVLPAGHNSDPQNVVVEDVSFRCWTDGTNYIVSVGARGGGLELPLKRINGEVALYSITYQNTASEEDRDAILEVVRTFEAR